MKQKSSRPRKQKNTVRHSWGLQGRSIHTHGDNDAPDTYFLHKFRSRKTYWKGFETLKHKERKTRQRQLPKSFPSILAPRYSRTWAKSSKRCFSKVYLHHRFHIDQNQPKLRATSEIRTACNLPTCCTCHRIKTVILKNHHSKHVLHLSKQSR